MMIRIINICKFAVQTGLLFVKGIGTILKTIWRGKRTKFKKKNIDVLIIGNGPSLIDIDLEKIIKKSDEIACVNFFPAKDNRFMKIKPEYLCLLDPVFFDEKRNTEQKQLLCNVLERVDWQLKIICHQKCKLPINNGYISYEWINSNDFYGIGLEKFRIFLYRNNFANCGQQNVVIGALYYFISQRVRQIYLAGVDLTAFRDIVVDEENNVFVEQRHHYEDSRRVLIDPKSWKKGELYKYIACFQTMFEQFYYVARYAEVQDVKIYNLSLNSFVDVFEKMRIE